MEVSLQELGAFFQRELSTFSVVKALNQDNILESIQAFKAINFSTQCDGLKNNIKRHSVNDYFLLLRFNLPISETTLEEIFKILREFCLSKYQYSKELFLVFEGAAPSRPWDLDRLEFSFFAGAIHLFILPEGICEQDSLVTLKPAYDLSCRGYCLPNNRGSYFFAPGRQRLNPKPSDSILWKWKEVCTYANFQNTQASSRTDLPSHYHVNTEPNSSVRQTKFQDKEADLQVLKYSLTYQCDVEHTQSLRQEASLSETQPVNFQQNVQYSDTTERTWRSKSVTCIPKSLQDAACSTLEHLTWMHEVSERYFFTQFYQDHYSELAELKALSSFDTSLAITGAVFGFAYFEKPSNNTPKFLGGTSIESGSQVFSPVFFKDISFDSFSSELECHHAFFSTPSFFSDGFSKAEYSEKKGFFTDKRIFDGLYQAAPPRIPIQIRELLFSHSVFFLHLVWGCDFHTASFLENYSSKVCLQFHLILNRMSQDINEAINVLLGFVNSQSSSTVSAFKELLSYVPLAEEERQSAQDALRVILTFFLNASDLEYYAFVELLPILQARQLLRPFYQIYIAYAVDFMSLRDLYFAQQGGYFRVVSWDQLCFYPEYEKEVELKARAWMDLIHWTPPVNHSASLPKDIQFCSAVLVYAARCYMTVSGRTMQKIREFWFRFEQKCLRYVDQEKESSDQLLETFLKTLTDPIEGLKLKPLRKIETLLVCLEKLLDHAIKHHTLFEQIQELPYLSLKWMDATHAILYEDFPIVSQDMSLQNGLIGYGKTAYTVTLKELKQWIENAAPKSNFLIPAVFRYLAKEPLREPLAYYRALLYAHEKDCVFVYQLLWAHYVAQSTGLCYRSYDTKKAEQFKEEAFKFLKSHFSCQALTIESIKKIITKWENSLATVRPQRLGYEVSLVNIWHEKGILPAWTEKAKSSGVPAVFSLTFHRETLIAFLFSHQEALMDALPFLETDSLLIDTLIAACFPKEKQEAYAACFSFLKAWNIDNSWDVFFQNLFSTLRWVSVWKNSSFAGDGLALYDALFRLYKSASDNVSLLTWAHLVEQLSMFFTHQVRALVPCERFLKALCDAPIAMKMLQEHPISLQEILSLYSFQTTFNFDVMTLMKIGMLSRTVSTQKDSDAFSHLFKMMHIEAIHTFFSYWLKDSPNWFVVRNVIAMLEMNISQTLMIQFIDQCLKINPEETFETYLALMEKHHTCSLETFLKLFLAICPKDTWFLSFSIWITYSALEHTTLWLFYDKRNVTAPVILNILNAEDRQSLIQTLELQLNAEHCHLYSFQKETIEEYLSKIARIKNEETLSHEVIANLYSAFNTVMMVMKEHPIMIETVNGMEYCYTCNTLPMQKIPILFSSLAQRLKEDPSHLESQLMLLGLSSEVLFRTTGKFPRPTQLISVIHSLVTPGHLLQEVKTGEGKSIIAALHAVQMIAKGETVFIATENEKLAEDGLLAFQAFYHALGIAYAEEVIRPQSDLHLLTKHGIHYGTPYGFSLFFISCELQGTFLPTGSSLILDEFDASATSTVQFRLAATLNPLLLDLKKWEKIYGHLLTFVTDKTLFLENYCTPEEDCENFRRYCYQRETEEVFWIFLEKLDFELLSPLIDAALLAKKLELDVDFLIVEKAKFHYCAPILKHTNRADPGAQFAGSQPLVHSLCNLKKLGNFSIAPDTETIVSISPKNFIDMFRLQNGRCIGLTGTPGSPSLIQYFETAFGMSAFSYASFNPDLCIEKPLQVCRDFEAQCEALIVILREVLQEKQPVLIVTISPKRMHGVETFLKRADFDEILIQTYDGYSKVSGEEIGFIEQAGKPSTISISTLSHARGADFDTMHPDGLCVINLCTAVTSENYRQIRGRTARNGKPGVFYSIFDETFLCSMEESGSNVTSFRAQFTMERETERLQKEILREALLSEGKFLIRTAWMELQANVNAVLKSLYGVFDELVSKPTLLQTLHDFDKKADAFYFELLGSAPSLTFEQQEAFFQYLVQYYNQSLQTWLPEARFESVAGEVFPLPLASLFAVPTLEALPIDALQLLSKWLQTLNTTLGPQTVLQYLPAIENYVALLFQLVLSEDEDKGKKIDALVALPLVNHDDKAEMSLKLEAMKKHADVGLKTFCVESLLLFGILNEAMLNEIVASLPGMNDEVASQIDMAIKGIHEYPKIATLLKMLPNQLNVITILEDLKKNFKDYSVILQEAIQARNWEALSLPQFFQTTIKKLTKRKELLTIVLKVIKPLVRTQYSKAIRGYLKNDPVKAEALIAAILSLEQVAYQAIIQFVTTVDSPTTFWQWLMKEGVMFISHPGVEKLLKCIDENGGILFQQGLAFINKLKSLENKSFEECLKPSVWKPLLRELFHMDIAKVFFTLFPLPQNIDTLLPKTARETLKVALKDLFFLLDSLEDDTLSLYYQLDLKVVLPLFTALMHPLFSTFIQSLPKEKILWWHVQKWLNETVDIETLPLVIQSPLKTFREAFLMQNGVLVSYQTYLKSIHNTALLTVGSLKLKHAALIPPPVEAPIMIASAVEGVEETIEMIMEVNSDEKSVEIPVDLSEGENILSIAPVSEISSRKTFDFHPFFWATVVVLCCILFSWLIIPVVLLSLPCLLIGAICYGIYRWITASHIEPMALEAAVKPGEALFDAPEDEVSNEDMIDDKVAQVVLLECKEGNEQVPPAPVRMKEVIPVETLLILEAATFSPVEKQAFSLAILMKKFQLKFFAQEPVATTNKPPTNEKTGFFGRSFWRGIPPKKTEDVTLLNTNEVPSSHKVLS